MKRTLLLDQLEISQLIFRFARALDLQEWKLFRSCFMEKIEADYSDFRGTPPTEMKANDFVEERRSALTGIQTQHFSANHVITIKDDHAICTSSAVIYRRDPKMEEGENFFDTHCYYEHTFSQDV